MTPSGSSRSSEKNCLQTLRRHEGSKIQIENKQCEQINELSFGEREMTMLVKRAAYNPEEIHLLRSVLERCSAGLEPSVRNSEIKAAMAERILRCAAIGERIPIELRIAAMQGMGPDSSDFSASAANQATAESSDDE
jgi:hypothetical protein